MACGGVSTTLVAGGKPEYVNSHDLYRSNAQMMN